jgi:hypothetical protein
MLRAMGLLSRLLGRDKGARTPPEQRPFDVVAHVAFEGAIHVIETPLGKDWQHDEDARDGDGFTVMVLKYLLPASPTPLALLAKIYTTSAGFAPPQDPALTDWRAIFGPLFAEISVAAQATHQTTMQGTQLPACEAIVDGTGADSGAPLRVRERRAVLNEEQFILTAMGTPDLFDAHAVDIENWFSTAAFVPISET